jgi:heme-degrading monooxygenase HmoA
MLQFVEMDAQVTLFEQMEDQGGPVVLINKFTVSADEADQLIAAWAADAAVMKKQPGYISAQLHQGIAGSGVFVNIAVWESAAHFKRAYENPEFLSHLDRYPADSVASPHLFRKVAVPEICIA